MRPNKTASKTPAHQLRDAASTGDLAAIRRLVQEGASVNDRSSFNNTALLYAAMHGKRECIRFLIDNGADVNIANDAGYTPLICSAKIGDYEAVRMLLDAGAEVWHTLKSEDGSPVKTRRTALALAEYNHHQKVVELLRGVIGMRWHKRYQIVDSNYRGALSISASRQGVTFNPVGIQITQPNLSPTYGIATYKVNVPQTVLQKSARKNRKRPLTGTRRIQ